MGLGCPTCELFTGTAPFESYSRSDGNGREDTERYSQFPSRGGRSYERLSKALLTKDRARRLGVLKGGAEDVKRHRFYTWFDWGELLNMKMQPPSEVPVMNYESLGAGR